MKRLLRHLLWRPWPSQECCVACGAYCSAAYPIALIATQQVVYACNVYEADHFIAEHSGIRLHRNWPLEQPAEHVA